MNENMNTNANINKYNGLRVAKVKFERLKNNNCYTYAINQYLNPYTNKPYSNYEQCQPGMLGGNNHMGRRWNDDFENYIPLIKKDLELIGYELIPSTANEYIEDDKAWKIAFCHSSYDYHFYRQNKNGTWSHKMGSGTVRKVDSDDKIIHNPEFCDRGQYDTFVGFFIIRPNKNKKENTKYIC